jgi:pyruvate dehydrogenase E1 component alpha subunit
MKRQNKRILDPEKLVDLYKQMFRIRVFEEGYEQTYLQGKMPGWAHLSIGQEAVAAGICCALRPDDYITSTHRGHGHLLAKGCEMKYIMAELFGKKTGYCGGKGGSMHAANFDLGVIGANGIVGGSLGIVAGAGLSAKMRKSDQAVVCFFGDGASEQGIFHEALNLASLWKLPVIYVAENNQFAEYALFRGHCAVPDIARRAVAYGIPGEVVDGMDVVRVYQEAKKAVQRARKGEGPTLLECTTYRFRGHFIGDLGGYQPEAEAREWMARDPVITFRKYLIQKKIMAQRDLATMEAEIHREFSEAVNFAEQSEYPSPDELETDVY